jgi:hypothetical protein
MTELYTIEFSDGDVLATYHEEFAVFETRAEAEAKKNQFDIADGPKIVRWVKGAL